MHYIKIPFFPHPKMRKIQTPGSLRLFHTKVVAGLAALHTRVLQTDLPFSGILPLTGKES